MAHYNCKVCERKLKLKIPSGHTAILGGLVVAAAGTYNKGRRKPSMDTPSGERRSSYNILKHSLLAFLRMCATTSSNHEDGFTQDFAFALSVNDPTRCLRHAVASRSRIPMP